MIFITKYLEKKKLKKLDKIKKKQERVEITNTQRKKEFALINELIDTSLNKFIEKGDVEIEIRQFYGDKSIPYTIPVSEYLYCLEVIKKLLIDNSFSFLDFTHDFKQFERNLYCCLESQDRSNMQDYFRYQKFLFIIREGNPISKLEGYPVLESWSKDFKKKYNHNKMPYVSYIEYDKGE